MVAGYAQDGEHRWPDVIPAGWTVHPQSGGWVEFRRASDGALLACYTANVAGARGLFAILGDRSILDAIAASFDLAAPARDVWEAAKAGPGLARDVMRRWRDWRIDGFERDPETGDPVALANERRRLMADEGFALPDPATNPLPWNLDANGQLTTQAAAVVRVTVIHRPALSASMANPWSDAEDLEATT